MYLLVQKSDHFWQSTLMIGLILSRLMIFKCVKMSPLQIIGYVGYDLPRHKCLLTWKNSPMTMLFPIWFCISCLMRTIGGSFRWLCQLMRGGADSDVKLLWWPNWYFSSTTWARESPDLVGRVECLIQRYVNWMFVQFEREWFWWANENSFFIRPCKFGLSVYWLKFVWCGMSMNCCSRQFGMWWWCRLLLTEVLEFLRLGSVWKRLCNYSVVCIRSVPDSDY